ncbi:MAG: acyltransferase [Gammaproteobacteria bacterium]|nr:acyltransferase [Gammaproteobacteria bacterium]
MKSSSGEHFIALDHVRALAALLVICWHFVHAGHGYPVPFAGAPAFFPLAVFDEGHTGVALFMVLSGYLFARLLNGKQVNYWSFYLNRALRLLPLLLCVIGIRLLLHALSGTPLFPLLKEYGLGVVLPTLPNGGWSITVEIHFYLLIPVLLLIAQRKPILLLAFVGAALLLRSYIHSHAGSIQHYAYFTLIGRADQFLFGILFFHARHLVRKQHLFFALATLSFLIFYGYFDSRGGFYEMPSYPSPSRLWIVLPTIEGMYFGLLIAWYDSSFRHGQGWLSRTASQYGKYSYAFYLWHFFFVFSAADLIHRHLVDLSNFYVALLFALLFYLAMYPVGYLSYRFIESPFLRIRKKYITTKQPRTAA